MLQTGDLYPSVMNIEMKTGAVKRKMAWSIFLLLAAIAAKANTCYVDAASGSNSNSGLQPGKAFLSLDKAAIKTVAGDTVFVMNGTYTSSSGSPLITETDSGTEDDWIVWINYPGHDPVLSFNGWQCIFIMGSYVEINGLTIRGSNASISLELALNQPVGCLNPGGSPDGLFNGQSIYTDGRTNARVHHITIRNCTIYECSGGGIQIIQTDYITIENNTIFNNAWYGLYSQSGISINQNWNSDNETGIKNIIRNNRCYNNRNYVPNVYFQCRFPDGNGIILDDFENTQSGSELGSYHGRTLVTNNILYAAPDNKINSNMSNGDSIIYDYNLHFGGTTAALTGSHSLKMDPLFMDEENFDFRLRSGSPAIDEGIGELSGSSEPGDDFDGNTRPNGDNFHIGAYEDYVKTGFYSSQNVECNVLLHIHPNPASGFVTVEFSAIGKGPVEIIPKPTSP
jgi:parallel beta-helix repeat protein